MLFGNCYIYDLNLTVNLINLIKKMSVMKFNDIKFKTSNNNNHIIAKN